MLHAAHTTKKTWWRNIIRYFATTSLPYVLHYADDGSQHIMPRYYARHESASARRLMVERGLDQAGEQRVRLGRARLELRVSLGGHIERVHVLRQFHELGELAVRALAGDAQAPSRRRSL